MARFADSLMPTPLSPLEQFIRDYADARDGVWDEIEPRVYDLLIGPDMMQVAFDPEALPERPGAQLASLGSPLLDRLLADAAGRWNSSRFYRTGLNLHPHGLDARLRRAISLPTGVVMRVERIRAANFPQALFWFKASFAGDQKEEEILPIAIDLHHLREVRHLDLLLDSRHLSEHAESILPEAPHPGLIAGYRAAQKQVAPTVASLANIRRREWASRLEKQINRMSGYYAQLREEAHEMGLRGADPAVAMARAASRREAVGREEAVRIAELRQKSAVHVSVQVASLMIVQQPKLLISAVCVDKNQKAGKVEAVWGPLSDAIEALPCPECGQPTFNLQIQRGGLRCDVCAARGMITGRM